jgi:hypothetical protein
MPQQRPKPPQDPLNAATRDSPPYRVRLPGFITREPVGLGDAVARVTSAFGVGTCGGCARRAAALNRWLAFSGTRTNYRDDR